MLERQTREDPEQDHQRREQPPVLAVFIDRDQPTTVYVVFPGEDVQVEVYDPDRDGARELVTSGRIAPIR